MSFARESVSVDSGPRVLFSPDAHSEQLALGTVSFLASTATPPALVVAFRVPSWSARTTAAPETGSPVDSRATWTSRALPILRAWTARVRPAGLKRATGGRLASLPSGYRVSSAPKADLFRSAVMT